MSFPGSDATCRCCGCGRDRVHHRQSRYRLSGRSGISVTTLRHTPPFSLLLLVTVAGAAGAQTAPAGVGARAASPTAVEIGWQAVREAVRYRIERAPDPRGPWEKLVELEARTTRWIDEKATAGSKLAYRVAAGYGRLDETGSGELRYLASEPVVVETPQATPTVAPPPAPVAPPPPAGFAARNWNAGTFLVTLDAPATTPFQPRSITAGAFLVTLDAPATAPFQPRTIQAGTFTVTIER